MLKSLIVIISLTVLFIACKSSNESTKKRPKQESLSVIGNWQMLAIRFNDGRVMAGEFMGNPYYEFKTDGKRIKTLRTTPAPPPETVKYEVKNDSIFYPESKFPAMKIKRLEKDTLVLSNEKLSWFMARDKGE